MTRDYTPAVVTEDGLKQVPCELCGALIYERWMTWHQSHKGCKSQAEANAARARGLVPITHSSVRQYLERAGIPTERHGVDTYDKDGKRISASLRKCYWGPDWAVGLVFKMRTLGQSAPDEVVRALKERLEQGE